MGKPAVHELIRRLAVNELLDNPDAHLKNFGVLYERNSQGFKPTFAPAFDIVPYAISHGIDGHALPLVSKLKLSKAGEKNGPFDCSSQAPSGSSVRQ